MRLRSTGSSRSSPKVAHHVYIGRQLDHLVPADVLTYAGFDCDARMLHWASTDRAVNVTDRAVEGGQSSEEVGTRWHCG